MKFLCYNIYKGREVKLKGGWWWLCMVVEKINNKGGDIKWRFRFYLIPLWRR